jgi:hypothetical protein
VFFRFCEVYIILSGICYYTVVSPFHLLKLNYIFLSCSLSVSFLIRDYNSEFGLLLTLTCVVFHIGACRLAVHSGIRRQVLL